MALNLSGILQSASSGITGVASKAANTAFDLLDPANARRAISGLLPGGLLGANKATPNIGFQSTMGTSGATIPIEDDWRVRVSLANGATYFYKDGTNTLMAPLVETNGVVWPYTPQITVTHQANYSSAVLTHSNYPAHFFNASEVADINISGEFTVQSEEEGQYLLAAVYFFRSATKMWFGQSTGGVEAGNPPPIVFLDGYGSHYFPHVPCVVTSFSHTLPNDADYVQTTSTSLQEVAAPPPPGPNTSVDTAALNDKFNTGTTQSIIPSLLQSSKEGTKATTAPTLKYLKSATRVPTLSTLSVTLRPIYSRKNLHDRFDLNKFASGGLLGDKNSGLGGFL